MRMLAVLALLAVAVPAFPPSLAVLPQAAYASFEDGMEGWAVDHHVGCQDADPPCAWAWSLDRLPGAAFDGAHGLVVLAEGIHDSGSVWVEKRLPVPLGATSVDVAFWALSPHLQPAAPWQARAYAGLEDPESEWDLAFAGHLDAFPGWSRHCVTFPVPEGADALWVAAGIRVSFEVTRAYAFDYVGFRASGAEPCSVLEDPCHVAGAPCAALAAACQVAACAQRGGS